MRLLGSTMAAAMLVGSLGQPTVLAAVENGWEEVDSKRYWYENGVKQGTEGRGKEIYDPGSDAWYWLDAVDDGKMAVSKDVYQESQADDAGNIGKWVRYDAEGHMVKGWNITEAGTYYFDLTYGTMAKGSREIDGVSYFFNEGTGIMESSSAEMENGWVTINGKKYWYENGVRQGYDPANPAYRGKEIYDPGSDAWYWLDNVQQGAKAGSKDVYQESQAGEWAENSDGTGKWVRYNSEGHMVKGWETTENGKYYFDPVYGTMAKGKVMIEGKEYDFDQTTGILTEEIVPTDPPTQEPTAEPSSEPTAEPTAAPTDAPDEEMEWNITDGKLTVTGKVVGEDIKAESAPWYDRREEITSVVMRGTGVGSFRELFATDRTGILCYPNVQEIDLRDLDTSAVTDMGGMFSYCSRLTNLDVSNFDTSAVTNMSGMFSHCSRLTSLDVSNFNTSAVTNMRGMFWECSTLTSLDVSHFDTSAVTSMKGMFWGCSRLTSLDVSNFDTSAVTDMNGMFEYCSVLMSLDISNFDTPAVTDMGGMFLDCNSLTSLDVSNFDTSAVTDMGGMFGDCNSLTSLDVSNFDASAVTNMWYMFGGCNSLTSLDVSNFDTSAVTDMSGMFKGCKNLTSLDISNFDTSAVTNMWCMFGACLNLTEILVDGSKWKIGPDTDITDMFSDCGVSEVTRK